MFRRWPGKRLITAAERTRRTTNRRWRRWSPPCARPGLSRRSSGSAYRRMPALDPSMRDHRPMRGPCAAIPLHGWRKAFCLPNMRTHPTKCAPNELPQPRRLPQSQPYTNGRRGTRPSKPRQPRSTHPRRPSAPLAAIQSMKRGRRGSRPSHRDRSTVFPFVPRASPRSTPHSPQP